MRKHFTPTGVQSGSKDNQMTAKPSRTKPATERRNDLMDAAERLFLEHGVLHTTIEQICNLAKVAKGTFYIYFASKEEVFNDAIDEELVSQNIYPFRRFKIKTEKTIKRSLSIDELQLLKDFDCEEYLIKYRDLFMLIFYLIGINIIDLLNLKEIKNGKVIYRRAKTGRLYEIAVQPEALEIFDKYKGKSYLLDVLDVYADYKDFTKRFNRNLKRIGPVEIGKKGINALFPNLTTYTARHVHFCYRLKKRLLQDYFLRQVTI